MKELQQLFEVMEAEIESLLDEGIARGDLGAEQKKRLNRIRRLRTQILNLNEALLSESLECIKELV